MKSAEAIEKLEKELHGLALSFNQDVRDRVDKILEECGTVEPEPCPGPILDAILDACRARGLGRQWVRGNVAAIVESVQLLGAPMIPAMPQEVVDAIHAAMTAQGVSYASVINAVSFLGLPSSPLPPPALDPCNNILTALHSLAAKMQALMPPTAPAASTSSRCLDILAALHTHAVKTDAQQKQAFAQLEARAQQLEKDRDERDDKVVELLAAAQKSYHEYVELENSVESLNEDIDARNALIVQLMLGDRS